MSRIVSIWLPRWPIQRFLMSQRGRHRSPDDIRTVEPVDSRLPFILTVEASGGPRIAAVSKAAEAEGLSVGGLVADARAKAPGLQTRPLEPESDRTALHRLGLWAMRYTPTVAAFRDTDGADGLFLDISGASHLIGGEEALLQDIARRLRHFSLGTRLALADTPGAAWALSRFHAVPAFIMPAGEDPRVGLAALPMAALRLPDALCATLQRLGFKRICDIVGKERAPFAARFDPLLLKRLDQALGARQEALTPIDPPPLYHRSRQLLEPVGSQAAVVRVATRLMQDLVPALIRDGLGARALQLRLFRVDGEVRTIHIGLASATRDPAHIARLVALDLERLGETIDAGFGFETLSLTATTTEKIDNQQSHLALRTKKGSTALGQTARQSELIDALRQRLGPGQVRQLHPVARHDPAQAETTMEVSDPVPVWPTADPGRLRPPLFFDRPEPLHVTALNADGLPGHFRWRGVHHVVTAMQGPERIAGAWWRQAAPMLQPAPPLEDFTHAHSHGDARSARSTSASDATMEPQTKPRLPLPAQSDYYIAQTREGRRFWLRCDQQLWFMQGLFA